MITGMFGGVMAMTWVVYGLLPLFPLIYLILRWRQTREGGPADPQLGLKTTLHYFRAIASHLTLIGVIVCLFSTITQLSGESILRTGVGLLIPGALVLLAQGLVLKATNDAEFPSPRRIFAGFNVVLSGLVTIGAMTTASVSALNESTGDPFRAALATTLVYGAFWSASAWSLLRASKAP